MNKNAKPVLVIFFVFIAVAAVVTFSKLSRPVENIPWKRDLPAALAEARTTKKPVFVYFTAEWCGPCQGLKQSLWPDPKVEAALQAFYPVKLDVDENPALAQQFAVRSIPQFVILNPDGEIRNQTSGSMDVESFLTFLR